MRLTKAILFALSLILLLILPAGAGSAAELGYHSDAVSQSGSQSSAPTLQVYSRETLVDVTVTDAKGNPVHGLKPSDFTISEDGKPQSIRSFEEFGKGLGKDTATPAAQRVSASLPPHVYTNQQAAMAGPLNVILGDHINGGGWGAAAAAKFIKGMAPGSQAALLSIGDHFTILQSPTSDQDALLKELQRSTKNPPPPFRAMAVACQAQILIDQATLDQLNQVAAYLSGIKGRKNLVWVGNGNSDLIFNICQSWTGPLRKTYDLLEDAQITVYPVDPRGLATPPYPSLQGPGSTYATQAAAQNASWQQNLATTHLSYEAVAEATGGEAFYNTNDIAASITGAADHGADYYTLSYVPPSLAYDGRYHSLNIKVDRPDVHLAYRKGYSAEDPVLLAHPPETLLGHVTRDTRPTGSSADALAAAMAAIAPLATQLLFNVRAQPTTEPPMPFDPPVIGALNPKLKNAPLTRYDVLFMLPQSQVAFADAGAGIYSGSLEFDLAAYDPDGRLVTIRSQTLKLPLTNEEYRQFLAMPFQFLQQLDLPPGQMTLRVGILDGVSSKIGTVDIPVTIPKSSSAANAASTR
jgi:VWFA-related protein